MIKISIAIPTFNEEKLLEKCLKSIYSQDYPKKLIEVIIVDNGSDDNTLKIAKKYPVKIIFNKIKDPEISKKMAFDIATGDIFMYIDADMELADKNWMKKISFPFEDNEKIIGVVTRFKVNPKHPAVNRCISYDLAQRDPLFVFLTPSIEETYIEKKKGYYLCKWHLGKIPPDHIAYRTRIAKKLFDGKALMDNDIPVVFVKNGYNLFGDVETGMYHFLLKDLNQLWRKRIRNLERSYFPYAEERQYKWINNRKDLIKIAIFTLYANLLLPATIYGAYKAFKYKDWACLYEPLIAFVSTNAMVFGVLRNFKSFIKMSYFS